ncbi:MAG: cytochrome c biogenesis protein DipZ [Gaiellaceae bacterium]
MLILVPIAFAAGVITAFTPCILPVLPIVLAGGPGSTRRPYAIAAGLVTTFTLFLLAGAWLWGLLGIGEQHQIQIGAVLLGLLALTLIVPRLGGWAERPLAFMTRLRIGDAGGGFVLGAALGLVFVPCGGPVLAALTSNVARERVGGWLVVVALAYALGVALPLLAIAAGSQRVAASFRRHAQAVRITAGMLMAAAAVVIYNGWAEDLQTKVPSYAQWLQDAIEGNGTAGDQLAELNGQTGKTSAVAPEVQGISAWINTQPLTLRDLRGKVVLIDFWTYSCINCLRTLPQLEAWDAKYRKDGLVIVGVHTPEFAFEHVASNVKGAVRRLGVRYPVVQDNDYDIWNGYSNQYWPAEYLIDRKGHVRHAHFGEGEYDQTEQTIRKLLGEKAGAPASTHIRDSTPVGSLTPESYLGYERLERYTGSKIQQDKMAHYEFSKVLGLSQLTYAGNWRVERQRIVAGPGARLRLRFYAQDAYLVIGGKGRVQVLVDGKSKPTIPITADKLYTVAAQSKQKDTSLELRFSPGVDAYAFTFG